MKLKTSELKDFLDTKVELYNNPRFIESDPIQIPHKFTKKEDIEIISFLTATIAWGNRKSIITNANKMASLLDFSPFDFVMNHSTSDLDRLNGFVHRTFNDEDFKQFIKSLKHVYTQYGGLETIFKTYATNDSLQLSIHHFKKHFFEIDHLRST